MAVCTANAVPELPGKTSFWTTRPVGKYDHLRQQEPGRPLPRTVGGGSLDDVHSAFWQALRHLFPPHALAVQEPQGGIVVSWSIEDEPQARYPYSAPVLLRFDEALLDAMDRADARQRLRLARRQEPALREGLRGYDPYARLPDARVVHLG
jgi:hypothetical protein